MENRSCNTKHRAVARAAAIILCYTLLLALFLFCLPLPAKAGGETSAVSLSSTPPADESTSTPDEGGNEHENSSSIPADSSDTGSTPQAPDSSGGASSLPDDSGGSASSEPPVATSAQPLHPFLTTPFDDYTVTEGILLVLLVVVVLFGILALFKGR